ncbi:HmuY family protein [Rapidithrix thailandica]|uniref:HmuY family protein n=1 Tax=Rapidithrix thailandica TaxID=413964 RepID=A0AAW9S637_9BACT
MTRFNTLLLLLWIGISLSSCSDDSNPAPKPDEPQGKGVPSGIYEIKNLELDTSASSSGQATTIYYSLEENKQVPASLAQTDAWDIAFTGIYNSSLAINNGTSTLSPGYGGPGKGAVYLIKDSAIDAEYYNAPGKPLKKAPPHTLFDLAFDKVHKVSISDEKFLTGQLGLDHFDGSGDGWAYYDFYNDMYPERPDEEKAHVVYPMPRTLLIRTARGNYAKLIVYSMYKDAPEDPDRSHQPGYLTFTYAIQKDGSKNLDLAK